MDRKTTDIVAYITIFGWLVAYVAGDKEDSRFHLNQALVINLTAIILAVLTRIPLIGFVAGLLQLVVFVFWIMGIVYAVKEQDNEVPLLGCIKLLK
ncbi:MAG: hypothetical protein HFH84_04695 [Lachnospiraceae bacterium]|nr:hypothetical protein [Lachnospiraceae bacterium]